MILKYPQVERIEQVQIYIMIKIFSKIKIYTYTVNQLTTQRLYELHVYF